MKIRTLWLAVSCLIALSLALASCAPATPTAPAPTTPTPTAPTPTAPTPTTPTPTAPSGPEMVKVTFTKLDGTKVEKLLEKPKYGNTMNIAITSDMPVYDHTIIQPGGSTYWYHNDPLFQRDHMRGPGGTAEDDNLYSGGVSFFLTGVIGESYEIPDSETIILHVRQGIHYHNIPPLNGREVTADDVVFAIKRTYNMLPDYPNSKSRVFRGATEEQRPLSVTATDKWTVVVKANPPGQAALLSEIVKLIIYARETTAKEGEAWPWDRNVGNGAWILKDVVPSTSWTFARNPGYWAQDYAFPENQLPYADGFKMLLITDKSTLLAALRTGKTDVIREIDRESIVPVLEGTPRLQVAWKLGNTSALYYRLDKPEFPWHNIKVRYAMQMAIDREAIKRDFYGGQADIYAWPIQNTPDYRALGAFVPLEELPANVQELFQYKPDKAKQLLAEAGYPNGFTMEVMTDSARVDLLSVVQNYLDAIGITLKIDVRERNILQANESGLTHKEGVFWQMGRSGALSFLPGQARNLSIINDPRVTAAIQEMGRYLMLDDRKAYAAVREVAPYILEQAWLIQMPTPMEAMVWQPWLKRYDGINDMGSDRYAWTKWAWLDQELKKSMGY